MATGCTKQLKAGKDFKTKKQLYKPCGLVCETGQTMCPRHLMLAELEQQQAADKEAAKVAERLQARRVHA